MSDGESAPSSETDSDAPQSQPEEIDARQMLDAVNRAMAAARWEAARLFDALLPAQSGSGECPEGETPGP